ncbi:MAG: VWA domain-containing protein [Caldilineaceae bacterium]|nr:VWA domain-containing protein [Caldilineaceae bacterium]
MPLYEGTVILTFDVSASMAAGDIEPSRMEAAKSSSLAFVQQKPDTIRVGLVAFSEGGMVVQQPTFEQIELLDAINRLAPQSGTSLGEGILAALALILTGVAPQAESEEDGVETPRTPIPTPLPSGSFDDAVIVLITDGEDMADSDPLEAAERAADYGVRVHTVGMGSAAGTTSRSMALRSSPGSTRSFCAGSQRSPMASISTLRARKKWRTSMTALPAR